MDELRVRLTLPPFLKLSRSTIQYAVDSDESDGQLCCVRIQEKDDSKLKPVAYCSKWLSNAKLNYDTTHKECLAVICSFLTSRPYLEGSHFMLRTDHNALLWTSDLKEFTRRSKKWILRLLEQDFAVVPR